MNKFLKCILPAFIQLFFQFTLYAQNDVTQFLDIPVDGYKADMIKKLRDKGFTLSTSNKEILVGEFNGAKVNIHIVTNNNKVCRIMLDDVIDMKEADIRIRFNRLCEQFKNNKKYVQLTESDYTISENEDISYMMTVKNKHYDAIFYQKPKSDSVLNINELENYALKKYTKKELSNLTESQRKELILEYYIDKVTKKAVWFRINERFGKYYITMYYDNEYNRANGDDL